MAVIIADWRDWRLYDQRLRHLSREQWRWEFLRRNPTYQADWNAYRVEGQSSAFFPDCEREYGLQLIYDPFHESAPQFVEFDLIIPAWSVIDGEDIAGPMREFIERATVQGYFITAIDPSLTFEANVKRIERLYRDYMAEFGERTGRTRFHDDVYPGYLRIIDARQSGATFEEILTDLESRGADQKTHDSLRQQERAAIRAAEKITGVPWPNSKAAS